MEILRWRSCSKYCNCRFAIHDVCTRAVFQCKKYGTFLSSSAFGLFKLFSSSCVWCRNKQAHTADLPYHYSPLPSTLRYLVFLCYLLFFYTDVSCILQKTQYYHVLAPQDILRFYRLNQNICMNSIHILPIGCCYVTSNTYCIDSETGDNIVSHHGRHVR